MNSMLKKWSSWVCLQADQPLHLGHSDNINPRCAVPPYTRGFPLQAGYPHRLLGSAAAGDALEPAHVNALRPYSTLIVESGQQEELGKPLLATFRPAGCISYYAGWMGDGRLFVNLGARICLKNAPVDLLVTVQASDQAVHATSTASVVKLDRRQGFQWILIKPYVPSQGWRSALVGILNAEKFGRTWRRLPDLAEIPPVAILSCVRQSPPHRLLSSSTVAFRITCNSDWQCGHGILTSMILGKNLKRVGMHWAMSC